MKPISPDSLVTVMGGAAANTQSWIKPLPPKLSPPLKSWSLGSTKDGSSST
jgi:hypothetical protein